jgi:hypothetical protein
VNVDMCGLTWLMCIMWCEVVYSHLERDIFRTASQWVGPPTVSLLNLFLYVWCCRGLEVLVVGVVPALDGSF